MKEITYEDIKGAPGDSYELIDIRDDGLAVYGMIPGAVHIRMEDLENSRILADIPREKKLVFYCEIGRISREIDDTLEYLEGRDCYSLSEGYVGYIRSGIKNPADKEEKRNLQFKMKKKYRKVAGYDTNGTFINEYLSIRVASEETGIKIAAISNTARGAQKTGGGYIWKYC